MKKSIMIGLVALALTACAKKEEAPAPAPTEGVEVAAPEAVPPASAEPAVPSVPTTDAGAVPAQP